MIKVGSDVGWKVIGARTCAFPLVRADIGSTVFMELGLEEGREASAPSKLRRAQTLGYMGVCNQAGRVVAPVPSQLCAPALSGASTHAFSYLQGYLAHKKLPGP